MEYSILHGRIQSRSVHDILDDLWDLIPHSITAVIRSIDSTRSQQGLRRILESHKIQYKIIDGNVCLTKEELRSAASAIFTGFDEVWLIEGKPDVNLPSIVSATSDASDFSIEVPSDIIDKANVMHCWLLLGDGCGLNYLSTDKRITNKIK